MAVFFHSADLAFTLNGKSNFKKWIYSEINHHFFTPGQINIIFCSDSYLLEVNKKYLNHDYFTDIITFNYNVGKIISGDLYISIERVNENSKNFKTEFLNELSRVMIHGILHLMGYNDNSELLKKEIHKHEDAAIQRFSKIIDL